MHFNSGMPDFGAVPRRGFVSFRGELSDRRQTVDANDGDAPETELSAERDRQQAEKRRQARTAKIHAGLKAEAAEQWAEALRIYQSVAQADGWTGGLRDRVEILTRLSENATPAAPPSAEILQTYFKNVSVDGGAATPETVVALDKIAADPAADWLRERAAYQAASATAEAGENAKAISRYQAVLKDFPNGAKRQETLIMLARTALLPDDAAKRNVPEGEATLNQLEKEFPQSRYRASTPGLRARILYVQGNYPAAAKAYLALKDFDSVELARKKLAGTTYAQFDAPLLAIYIKRLGEAKTWADYAFALTNIDRTRKRMTAESSRQFAALAQQSPELASAYLYYRLYHTENTPADMKNMTLLANALANRYGKAKLPPAVRVRLAEVYYQRKLYPQAREWASSVTGSPVRDRALYVSGAAKQKSGQNAAALADFNSLLTHFPDSTLRRAARENVAILNEATGNRSGALDQYFALNYRLDLAFLLDVRMTPQEIEAYIKARPKAPQYDLLAYSLGIRYLREERWKEAETWLKRVSPAKYAEFNKQRETTGFFDTASPAPLDALRDLRGLYQNISDADSNDARAAALYAYASYYSTHGTVLLYNGAVWQGERAGAFHFFLNQKQTTPEDAIAIRNHMISHEVYSRSRRICLELARRYPTAPVAPAAVYRAACACRRLANFNTWWDGENKQHNYWDEATLLMNRVADSYPKSPQAVKARKYAAVFQKEKKGQWN